MNFLLVSSLLVLSGLGIAFYLWRREKRYLKGKTSQGMSGAVWNEIVAEREAALKKRRSFRQALADAKTKDKVSGP
ncbi:MAG: hypothetical protein HY466_04375 [Deltaproteobacteria bacterium]|nr:hypothetical protein [Deltaproteobacteria bacterium]